MSAKQDDDNGESGWTESGYNLLRRGLSVGKNVAIAGAAVSVAPVLVPPLLVFSAFGLALSVPFSMYFAGMVGTERLMGSLLPLDQDDQVRNNGDEDYSEESMEKLGEKDEEDLIIETVRSGQESREDKERGFDIEQQDEEISSVPVVNEGEDTSTASREFDVRPIKVKPIIEESTKRNEKEQAQKEEQKKVDTTKATNESKGENGSHFESTVTTDREESQYNKKQLWEQIRALRIVIGYKAPIGKNLPDEMRALYQFTGVELPLTASDVTNIMDLNYKLHFLKSVIGVK